MSKNSFWGLLLPLLAVMEPGMAGNLPWRMLEQGYYSGIETQRLAAIKDASALRSLWKEHTAHISPAPAVPEVDFAREMAIAVFAGSQGSGGFRLQLEAITDLADRIEVDVVLLKPGADCMSAAVVTQPYMIVAAPQSEKPVVFHWSTKDAPCQGGEVQ